MNFTNLHQQYSVKGYLIIIFGTYHGMLYWYSHCGLLGANWLDWGQYLEIPGNWTSSITCWIFRQSRTYIFFHFWHIEVIFWEKRYGSQYITIYHNVSDVSQCITMYKNVSQCITMYHKMYCNVKMYHKMYHKYVPHLTLSDFQAKKW